MLSIFAGSKISFAQSIWNTPVNNTSLRIEILKPYFQKKDVFTSLTSASFLSFRTPVSERVQFIADLPFFHSGLQFKFDARTENTVGNPYVGLVIRQPHSSIFTELGVRLPFASEANKGATAALFTDLDRGDAFTDHTVSLLGLVNYQIKNQAHFLFRLRMGPDFLLNIKDRLGAGANLIYNAQIGYVRKRFSLLGGLSGRWNVSEGFSDFRDANHQLGFAASLQMGVVRPGVQVRIPVDYGFNKRFDDIGFVLGFQVEVELQNQ